MNALEALKLARESGCKVRPKGQISPPGKLAVTEFWYEFFKDTCYLARRDEQYGQSPIVSVYHLINLDGSPVEWEVVP